ncbi:unnamed protein product [Anisakis simplex]|uniref:RING-type E3 ubiquitin transferase n=1 Tax=Anisakis simplex TaxID=6269 RepID=A0A158PND8_ANISI|nr:unnamed protein product [Anisakis simplex]
MIRQLQVLGIKCDNHPSVRISCRFRAVARTATRAVLRAFSPYPIEILPRKLQSRYFSPVNAFTRIGTIIRDHNILRPQPVVDLLAVNQKKVRLQVNFQTFFGKVMYLISNSEIIKLIFVIIDRKYSPLKEKTFPEASLGAKLPEGAAAKCSVAPEHKLSASAAEFVPSWMKAPQVEQTYANASGSTPVLPLCPYFEAGNCEKGDECEFVHGMVCDMCNYACLHPADSEQRAQHKRECMAAHEAAMEEAFAEARSADKVCGICMESIRERDARFGILEGCRHCFCLECIRKWRRNQSEDFEKETVRSCPECRTHSDFVIPAKYWVEDANDKKKLIDDFRANAKQKRCKYMKKGNVDDCPFGNKCFYKHQLPDGTVVEGKSPRQLRRNAAPRLMFHI